MLVELLDHHRLLVEQVGVVRERAGSPPPAPRRPRPTAWRRAAARPRRRSLARASSAVCSGTRRISSRASAILPWRGEQRGAARLHLERALRVVDLGQPALRRRRSRRCCSAACASSSQAWVSAALAVARHVVVAIVVGDRRRPGRRADRGAAFDQPHVGLAARRSASFGCFSSSWSAPSVSHGGASVGLALRQRRSSCARRIGQALRCGQRAHVEQAQAGRRWRRAARCAP